MRAQITATHNTGHISPSASAAPSLAVRDLAGIPFTALYLGLMFCTTAIAGVRYLHYHTDWTLADWLINYQGGFVRRGLVGELALHLARLLHTSPLLLVLVFSTVLYAAMYGTVYRLVRHLSWSWWTLLLFVSPVTVGFQIVSTTSYHKDVLFLAGLGVLVLGLLEHRFSDLGLSLYLTAFASIAVLTHEPSLVYLPYVCAAVIPFIPSPRRLAAIGLLPAITVLVCYLAVMGHPGNRATVTAICNSLHGTAELCGGSIDYLATTKAEAFSQRIDNMNSFHYLRFYPVLTALAVFPVLGWLWVRRDRLAARVLAAALVLSSIGTIQLLRYTVDWGRFIQMNIFCAFLLILTFEHDEQNPPLPRFSWRYPLLALYATCWSLPAFSDIPIFGYLAMAGRFARRLHPFL